jgi:hypothetical protein
MDPILLADSALPAVMGRRVRRIPASREKVDTDISAGGDRARVQENRRLWVVVPRAFSWAADGYERLVAPQAVLLHQFRHRRGALCDRLGVLRGRVGPRRSPHRCGRDGQMRLGWR